MWPTSIIFICIALALVLVLAGCAIQPPKLPPAPAYGKWAAYYGAATTSENFQGYDLVVLDSDQHPDIKAIQAQGTQVLAYISLGEVAPYRGYYQEISTWPNFIVDTNEEWGSHIIDIRQKKWQQLLTHKIIPELMNKGFDGVMFDTIDTSIGLEQRDPNTYEGMQQAAVKLVKAIRKALPSGKHIMINRGFEILPHVAPYVNIILAESIAVDATKPDRPRFTPEQNGEIVRNLVQLKQKYRHLSIFSLDYPDLSDKRACGDVRLFHERQGFNPYIATMDLQQLSPECGMAAEIK